MAGFLILRDYEILRFCKLLDLYEIFLQSHFWRMGILGVEWIWGLFEGEGGVVLGFVLFDRFVVN